MPCCADGGCSTGACDGALFPAPKKVEEEKLCGAEGSGKERAGNRQTHKRAPAAAQPDSDHCDSKQKEAGKREPAKPAKVTPPGTANVIKARLVAAPCPKDCCATTGTYTQSRWGRDPVLAGAIAAHSARALIYSSLNSQYLPQSTSAHLKRLRGRAPPQSLQSNPA